MCFGEVEGNLLELIERGVYDVIINTANCYTYCNSDRAEELIKIHGMYEFPLENPELVGHISKLGMIDYENAIYSDENQKEFHLSLVNAYTQVYKNEVCEEALIVCLKKINNLFQGKKIAMYRIDCDNWNRIRTIIKSELKDCCVTIFN